MPGATPLEAPFASPRAAGLHVPARVERLLDGVLGAASPKGIRRRRGGGVAGVGDGRRRGEAGRAGATASTDAALEKLRTPEPKVKTEAPARPCPYILIKD